EIHVEEVGSLPVRVTDRLIAGADTSFLAGWEVVRIHIESQPAFGRTVGNRLGLEGMHARPLEDHQGGESSFLGWLGEVALHMRAEAVEPYGVQFDARDVGLSGRQDGVDRNGGEGFQFAVPELV